MPTLSPNEGVNLGELVTIPQLGFLISQLGIKIVPSSILEGTCSGLPLPEIHILKPCPPR